MELGTVLFAIVALAAVAVAIIFVAKRAQLERVVGTLRNEKQHVDAVVEGYQAWLNKQLVLDPGTLDDAEDGDGTSSPGRSEAVAL